MNNRHPSFHDSGRHITVTVTDIAMPGDLGVAKADDFVLFVPGTIPGDRVTVRIVKREKRYGYGEVIAIEKPSSYRVEPPCPHFGTCGGCTIQSMGYTRQLELKSAHLRQTLKRIGRIDAPEDIFEDITPSPAVYWYRSKVELAFGNALRSVIAGMRMSTSPAGPAHPGVVAIPGCRIFNPSLKKIVDIVDDHIHGEGYSPYDEQTKRGYLRHLIVRQSMATGALMVILETKDGQSHDMGELYRLLKREVPEVTSMWRAVNNRPGPYIDYGSMRHEGGDLFMEELLSGLRFRVYPASFFQPNPAAAGLLYERIGNIAAAGRFGNVLGLYCGMGPIELALSRHVRKVVGIDSQKVNIENARENALINGITNCSFLAGKIEDIAADPAFKKPDLVVIDPPRTGVSQRGIGLITSLAPGAIFYVSCNPATLARDLAHLTAAGFSIELIAPFDFFPHTSHLETLTVLRRTVRRKA